MSETILKINDLKVNYGGIEAVKGISFDVPAGQIVTLIGANGAGKSSTLRTIAGLVKPSGGSIEFEGENITGLDPTSIVTKGITLVPEGRKIFPDLTVLENLKIGAYLRKDDLTDDLNWVYDLFPRLKERSWQEGGTLSGGEQQMLAVGRALMSRPKVIMMDEPSLGLAPIIVQTTLQVASVILSIAGLSFIGLGIPAPRPEWGAMLSGGRAYLRNAPHLTIFPGIAIIITILSLNLLGDGLRDALDPKLKK